MRVASKKARLKASDSEMKQNYLATKSPAMSSALVVCKAVQLKSLIHHGGPKSRWKCIAYIQIHIFGVLSPPCVLFMFMRECAGVRVGVRLRHR